MPAAIKETEIQFKPSVKLKFGFAGLEPEHTNLVVRALIRDEWPKQKHSKQCVYFVRLTGDVVPIYPKGNSPTVYIGEGEAKNRLLSHIKWLTPLITSVPGMGLEVVIAEVVRPNHPTLYQYVEADLIAWFAEKYGSIPWFNKQRENSKEGIYEYNKNAKKLLISKLLPGFGNSFKWAIRPTPTNPFFNEWKITRA